MKMNRLLRHMKNLSRNIKFLFQKIFIGFSDKELFEFDTTVAKFLLPRLIRFRKITISYPSNLNNCEEWEDILDEIIYALSYVSHRDDPISFDMASSVSPKEEFERVNAGLKLLGQYFMDLWI